MKKKLIVALLLMVCLATLFVGCSAKPSAPKSDDTQLRVLQLADIQFSTKKGVPDKDKALLDALIFNTQPDLIILTGDQTSSERLGNTTLEITKQFCDYFDSKKIKWTAVFGNHDALAHEASAKQIYEVYKASKYFIDTEVEWEGMTQLNNEEDGITNFSLPLKDKNGKVLCNLLLLDTIAKMTGYEPFTTGQTKFYNDTYNNLKEANNGEAVPQILFTHIPLMMFNHVYINRENKDICVDSVGENEEKKSDFDKIASSANNVEFEEAMLVNKDIKGVFVGHDHLNYFVGNYKPFNDMNYLTKSEARHLGLTNSRVDELKGDGNYNVTLSFCRQSSYQLDASEGYLGMTNKFVRGARVIDIKANGFETSDVLGTMVNANKNTFKVTTQSPFWTPFA